jgi:hypothetical protein
MSVHAALFRVYRPIMLWSGLILVLVVTTGVVVISAFGNAGFSLWLLVVGSASKYWLLVVGIMLVSMQLKQFVANGVTRHEFLAGAAVFGLLAAIGFAVIVPLGHGIESLALGLLDRRPSGYPVFGARVALAEFGRSLPGSLAFLVSGGLYAITFYRFRAWLGVLLLVPATAPIGVSQWLLGIDERAVTIDVLPYLPAVALSLLATLAGAVAFRWAISDVAVRRTAG